MTNVTARLTAVLPPLTINVLKTGTTISMNSILGLNYTLEYKNALTDASWTSILPAVPGTGGTIVLKDTTAPGTQRFYRVSCD